MWEVYEHRRMDRRVQRLSVEILKRYEKWKDIVRISGPAGLRLIKGVFTTRRFVVNGAGTARRGLDSSTE